MSKASTRKIMMLVVILFISFTPIIFAADNHSSCSPQTEIIQSDHHADAEHSEEGSHGVSMTPLFFTILALLVGAATRHFLRKSPLPFTVTLLIIGLLLGLGARLNWFGVDVAEAIQWAGNIDPHLILFIFLPTLIFEAAFGMDVHTFKKTSVNAVLLAGPGIVVALILTGAIMMSIKMAGIGLGDWTWQAALLFGAVVSATDPVAVVALLKELGASKKLGTLIEGESVLNDGTAIVIFLVLLGGITGTVSDSNPLMDFLWVAFGGLGLGLIVGGITIAWVRRVFNDAMVEISVIVAAAYITFYIAEHFLHVSGVLGLFAFGLSMAGVGRTSISPEVEHFLHEFWELAVFIANTLIFLIVGVVIAQRIVFTAQDFIILGLIYVGVHIVRAIMIAMFYPVMKRMGYGMNRNDAIVLWYGALRGAIALALALMVTGESAIPEIIRNQFLFYTAGIVTLTLLINATTIKYVLNALGMTKLPPAKALMIYNANQYLAQSSSNAMEKLKSDRYMNRAKWDVVEKYLTQEPAVPVESEKKIETIFEMRRRILEKEKSSYWHQYKDSMIGAAAVRNLSDGISTLLDSGGKIPLSQRKDLEELWQVPKGLGWFRNLPVIREFSQQAFFNKMAVSYDCSRGFIEAQEEAIKMVESISRSLDKNDKEAACNLQIIEEEINENKIHGQTFLRNLRKNNSDIYDTLATRLAINNLLNYELKTVERLEKNGRIDSGEAQKMIESIEERIKETQYSPPKMIVKDNMEVMKSLSWLSDINSDTFKKVMELCQQQVFAQNEVLSADKTPGDSIFIIVKGNVEVTKGDKLIASLGVGSTVGEISVLLESQRTATITAITPVIALRIKHLKLFRIMQESEELTKGLWQLAGTRFAENILKEKEPYKNMRTKLFTKWLQHGEIKDLKAGETMSLTNKVGVIIKGGTFAIQQGAIIENDSVTVNAPTKIFVVDRVEV